jgi:hypothetical protein
MEYRYQGSLTILENGAPVGDGDGVSMVRYYAGAPATAIWRPGRRVLEAGRIWPGTAIATFAGPGAPYGNGSGDQAALFLSAGPPDVEGRPTYIMVMDLFQGQTIRSRTIQRFTPQQARGLRVLDCDNAETFYIIR